MIEEALCNRKECCKICHIEKTNSTYLHEVAKRGVYYYPATNSHPEKNKISIACDKCKRKDLVSCISKDGYDLCLKCVDDILNEHVPTKSNNLQKYIMNFDYLYTLF